MKLDGFDGVIEKSDGIFFQEFPSGNKAGEKKVHGSADDLLCRNGQSLFFTAASTLSGVHGPTLDVC